MTDRSILITGCSSGIGYTCALGMAQRGWRVFATARTDTDLDMLKAQGLEPVRLDYTDAASISSCVATVLENSNGRLTAVFNNGAYGQPGFVEDLTVSALRKQFEANFFGWHDLTRQLIGPMRAHGHGRIVQCSSVLGLVAMKYRGAYNASKFAVEGLTDTLRLELQGSGIHVSTIQPGPIRSRFVETALAAMQREVDMENSVHAEQYARRIEAMKSVFANGPAPLETPEESRRKTGGGMWTSYRLGPDAVLDALIHATESDKPRPHYRVTSATVFMAWARRLLPVRTLDSLARRSS